MYRFSFIKFFFIIQIFLFNCFSTHENLKVKVDNLSSSIFLYDRNTDKKELDSEEVNLENLFFDEESSVKKIIKFKPIDDTKIEVTQIDFHFFVYKDSFLEKIWKGKKTNLQKYFLLVITKKGIGHKKSESILQIYFDKYSVKKSESNTISDLISSYKKSAKESSTNYLEKKILQFPTSEIVAVRDELIKKNSIILSDPTFFGKFQNKNGNIILQQSENLLILLNNSNESQFSKEFSAGVFNTKYQFDNYEAPLIIYKRKENP